MQRIIAAMLVLISLGAGMIMAVIFVAHFAGIESC